jgi:hypothetical protein
MRKVLVLAAIILSSVAYGGNSPKLVKEIRNKAIINLNKVKLDAQKRDFVAVKFIIRNGEIEILNIKGTQEVLEDRVKEKLESMEIDSDYEENKKYVMKFKFENE